MKRLLWVFALAVVLTACQEPPDTPSSPTATSQANACQDAPEDVAQAAQDYITDVPQNFGGQNVEGDWKALPWPQGWLVAAYLPDGTEVAFQATGAEGAWSVEQINERHQGWGLVVACLPGK